MEQQSVQCRNGCGFYGNAASEGYCSVCYKDIIKKKQQPPTNMPASLAPAPGQMAGLSIDEAKVVGAPSLLATASPTVIVPPSQNEVSVMSFVGNKNLHPTLFIWFFSKNLLLLLVLKSGNQSWSIFQNLK